MIQPQTIDQIEAALLKGVSDEHAAQAARISPALLHRAEQAEPALAERLDAARAAARIENLDLIRRAAIGHPSRTITEQLDPETGKVTSRTTVERIEYEWRAGAWLEDRPPARRQLYRGRATSLNDDTAEQIYASFRLNPHVEPAAGAAGISIRTLQSWLARGRTYRDFLEGDLSEADQATRKLYFSAEALWPTDRQAALSALALIEDRTTRPTEEPYLRLLHGVEQATGQLELELSRVFIEGALRDPKLAERALRLLFRARYGDRLEVTGKEGAPIEIDLQSAKDEALEILQRVDESRAL